MNSPHHPHHEHHDVHQQRLLWFFSFCNQRSSSSSSSSSGSQTGASTSARRLTNSRRKSATNRNKFALQYQQQLQQQQRQTSNVFGRDLIEHTQSFSDDDSVPHIVKSCTRFIEKHGIIFGIYRLSGMRTNIHKLRQDFDKNPKISMIDSEAISNDAHAVACVLKQYFRELPTPLLTFHMYERFIELFKHCNQETDNSNSNNNNSSTNNKDNNNDNTDNNDKNNNIQAKVVANTKIGSINPTVVQPVSLAKSPEQKPAHGTDHDINKDVAWPSDNEGLAIKHRTSNKTTSQPKRPPKQRSIAAIITTSPPSSAIHHQQQQFTSSASDSQLLSLSSMVTTTNSDIRYQVKLEDLRQLLLELPRAHYQTLRFLMRHLACIATNGQKTGMDSKNVAIVWAPNLLKPRELELSAGLETLQIIGLQAVITEQLIKHHQFLFGGEDDDGEEEENQISSSPSLDDGSLEGSIDRQKIMRDNDNDELIIPKEQAHSIAARKSESRPKQHDEIEPPKQHSPKDTIIDKVRGDNNC